MRLAAIDIGTNSLHMIVVRVRGDLSFEVIDREKEMVRFGAGTTSDTALVVDIGGGSVEITRGTGQTMEAGKSFKLGVIRLTERFVKNDPLTPREERKLVRHIEEETGKYLGQLARQGFDR